VADLMDDLGSPGAPEPAAKPAVKLRRFDDVDTQRQDIYDHAVQGVHKRFPVENATHRLELVNAGYDKGYSPTKADEKTALLSGGSLNRPLKGTLRLVDKASGNVLDEKTTVLAHVPHMTSRGLFIRGGNVWHIRNQSRLRPGIYVRRQQNGGVEAHINVSPRTGRGFRLDLEPETGIMKVHIGQSAVRLYPVLKSLGVTDDQMGKAWGSEILKMNRREPTGHDVQDLRKIVQRLGCKAEREVPDNELSKTLHTILDRSHVDPDTTELTMGQRLDKLSPDVLLAATRKVLRVSTGHEEGDNRDSQAFQSIHSAEDLIRERLERDQEGAAHKLLWQASRTGKLDRLSSGLLSPNVHALFRGSGLAHTPEDVAPYEIYDQRQAVTRLGEGGISSERSVSKDARGVQPSHLGLIDPIRAPESARSGLDLRVTDAALKGSDNELYTQVRDAKSGQTVPMTARQLASKVLAFPGELAKGDKKVRAMVGERMRYVDRSKVDFELTSANHMLSRMSNMVAMPEGVKSQRLLMGARFITQSLPLINPETPLVASQAPDGKSYYEHMGTEAGAIRSDKPGVVTAVSPDGVTVLHPDGEQTEHQLFNNYPNARKTGMHNTPMVGIGDRVEPGQLIAKSNFTNNQGHAAPGLNLRVAYLSGRGGTYEDSIMISESAAKKLSSEHYYRHKLQLGKGVKSTDTKGFRAIYGDKYTPDQYNKLDDNGVVRVGQTVNSGDPLMVALGQREGRGHGALMDTPKSTHTDASQLWEHNAPGVVTDVHRTRSGIHVSVKSYSPMGVADKLSSQYGNKGVLSSVVPDDQMPHDEQGRPLEVLLGPTGVVTRVNPSVLSTSLLGKIAEKRGQPYLIPSFSGAKLADFALEEARKHGVKETETLTDPRDGRKIPNVFVGNQYMMKLHHQAEGKLGARETGGYTMDEAPARGGYGGSKRVAILDQQALLSYGAHEFMKDAKLIRGQRNDDYWRKLKMGETPTAPTESYANKHFLAQLTGAGIHLKKLEHGRTQLSYMTDKDIDGLAPHAIDNSKTFDFKTMKPVAGGLFDLGKTGGADGTRWTHIKLDAKIPNPLAEESITRILGLTGKQFDRIMAGQEELDGHKGGQAIEHALKKVDLDREIEQTKNEVRTSSRTKRDSAVRKLGYLVGLKTQGVKPADLMLSKLPVLPPKFRPVVRTPNLDIVTDANHMYHDILEANRVHRETQDTFGHAHDQYATLYQAAKAAAGLANPVDEKKADAGVQGLLRFAIGIHASPKFSRYQRKVMGNAVDTVGRGVITVGPDMHMDQVGLPEDMAWTLYQPWITRRLVRSGMTATQAVKEVRNRSAMAEKHLLDEMKERPVVYNRAPSLHRYNYVGAEAHINKDRSDITIPYVTTKGAGADFDGDAINVHVPVSDAAVKEVYDKLMPSKNLLHPNSFDVHMEPMQEYLAGLYLATKKDDQKPVRTFITREDAKKAYARGEIGIRDPVQILQP
jgi:DNA-directed RNA polymerase beta subunit